MCKRFFLLLMLVVASVSLPVQHSDASTWSQFFSNVKSIQTGTVTTSGNTGTATISSVNTAKSVLIYDGFGSAGPSALVEKFFPYIALTNATTVTATQLSSSSTSVVVSFTVVEYN